MSSQLSFSRIPADRRAQYDERLDAFEKVWRAGQRPLIEDILKGTSGAERCVLFEHALRLELELRRERGEVPAREEYLTRFADEADLIAQIHADERTVPYVPATKLQQEPQVPGYVIEKELGRGGMGVVYKTWQPALERTVALKTPSETAEVERFETEAQALARLQHPGIVQVFEIGEHDGRPFMALEFCAGGTLAAKLAKNPLPPREAAELVRLLAEAMQAAHAAQVIHRDLKPANVLLTEAGRPKITDFGLAKKLDEQGPTRTGSVMGTASYMPPEQAEGNKEVGPAADVYALGAILYECLTGRPPFTGATPLEILWQVCDLEPVPPRQLNPAVPRALGYICMKCLRKEPKQRYASAADLADDLVHCLNGEPIKLEPWWEWLWRQFQLPCRIDRVIKWASLFCVSAGWRVLCHGVMTVLLRVEVAPMAYWVWFLGLHAGDWLLVWRWLYSENRLDPTERSVVLNWAGTFAADALLLAIFCPLWGQARPEEVVRVYTAWLAVRGLWYVMEARRSWGRFYAVGFGFFLLTPWLSLCGLLAPAAYALISASAHLWLATGFYRLAKPRQETSGSNGLQTQEGHNGKQ
jgi:predicted Ser/Thr protein kinase